MTSMNEILHTHTRNINGIFFLCCEEVIGVLIKYPKKDEITDINQLNLTAVVLCHKLFFTFFLEDFFSSSFLIADACLVIIIIDIRKILISGKKKCFEKMG